MRHDTCGFCRHHLCGDYRSAPRTALCVFWRKERRSAPYCGTGRNAFPGNHGGTGRLLSEERSLRHDDRWRKAADCPPAAVVALHLWKKNTLLSIGAGTALYMLLIRL